MCFKEDMSKLHQADLAATFAKLSSAPSTTILVAGANWLTELGRLLHCQLHDLHTKRMAEMSDQSSTTNNWGVV